MKNKYNNLYSVDKVTNLKHLIDLCASKFGDKKVFWYKKKSNVITVSYKQFKDDIVCFGTSLHKLGLLNKHIAVFGENSYEWLLTFFAVTNGRNVIVPIDKQLPAENIVNLLNLSDCYTLIYSDTYSDIVSKIKCLSVNIKVYINMSEISELINKGKYLVREGNNSFENIIINDDDLATIMYTSGTTGESKGVMLTHKNLTSDAVLSSENLLIPEGTVLILPLHHTYGLMAGVIVQFIRGYPIFINTFMKAILNDIKFACPRHIVVVPLYVELFYKEIWSSVEKQGKKTSLKRMIRISNIFLSLGIDIRRRLFKTIINTVGGNLEMIISGGAKIDEKYIKWFNSIGITIINGYGITECSPIIATMKNDVYNLSSVGIAHPETKIMIKNPDMNGIGEICIKGDIVCQGYYNNPVANSESFIEGWFITGDLGRVDKYGFIYITGRKKNLIILSNGENVAAEELENLVYTIPYVKETLVYGKNNIIVAEVYLDCNIDVNVYEKINNDIMKLNKLLPSYKNIGKVIIRDKEFNKTSTMKIKR